MVLAEDEDASTSFRKDEAQRRKISSNKSAENVVAGSTGPLKHSRSMARDVLELMLLHKRTSRHQQLLC